MSTVHRLDEQRIGRITLTILLVIMTILAYANVNATGKKASPDTECASVEKKQEVVIEFTQLAAQEDAINHFEELKDELSESLGSDSDTAESGDTPETAALEKPAQTVIPVVDPDLREDVAKELSGTRMEAMIDPISSYDRKTAALLVGVAKSESGYTHNYSYNFWGYAGGYYPFSTPEQAVHVVGNKLDEYKTKGLDTPQKLVTTWKCGRSCASHSPESVSRWISTASGPYNRIAANL